MQRDDDLAELAAAAAHLGRQITAAEAGRLLQFFELLLAWNRRINLTGARSLKALVSDHLPDSVALAQLVPRAQTLLDVGSGGGLPAIPFALLRPDVALTMLEPRTRRAAFLRTAVRELAIPATVDTHRLEQLTGHYDVVAARAVLPPDPWLAAAAPRLTPQGRIIVYLSDPPDWRPPPGFDTAATVRYQAAQRDRLALALTVPRGT